MNSRTLSNWLPTLACVVALLFAALTDMPDAGAKPKPESELAAQPSAPAAPRPVHGLAPLPGGVAVPLSDRPPGAFADDGGPSPGIFPPQKITIRFNHKKHVKELGIVCTACHDGAKTSRKSADRLLPPATRCDACHGSDHRDLNSVQADGAELMSQCGFCHIGYKAGDGNKVARFELPQPNLKMNHAVHFKRNIGCAQCHGNVENIELATR
ncbi:MAG TPA: cytochrome c3 family protein, partial [Polyangiaceae bacterium]|nr:cytochrome c3 family protein [Polyangiaceae bacterium]